MTTTQLDPILTPDELADYLHVSSKTLNEWRAAGKGPRCIRLGTSVQAHVRYRVADVAEWLTATNSESAA